MNKKNNKQDVERIKLEPTSQILSNTPTTNLDQLEQEFRQMSKEELLYRLNYEENDHNVIKLIKKIIKEKK